MITSTKVNMIPARSNTRHIAEYAAVECLERREYLCQLVHIEITIAVIGVKYLYAI